MSQGQSQINRSLFQSGFAGDSLARQKEQQVQRPEIGALVADLSEAQGTCKLIHGANEDDLPIVGQTVGKVRQELGGLFNVAPGATALIDGEAVGEDHIMVNGQVLEFIKETGVKGA